MRWLKTFVSTVRTITWVSHALQRQWHVASSCTQGRRSAALPVVLPWLKTTFSCLVDTTSPWSVPIRVSCSTGKEKFQFVIVNPQGGCPISRDPGVRYDASTAILSSLAQRRIFKADGDISVPHTASILSTFLNWFIMYGRKTVSQYS